MQYFYNIHTCVTHVGLLCSNMCRKLSAFSGCDSSLKQYKIEPLGMLLVLTINSLPHFLPVLPQNIVNVNGIFSVAFFLRFGSMMSVCVWFWLYWYSFAFFFWKRLKKIEGWERWKKVDESLKNINLNGSMWVKAWESYECRERGREKHLWNRWIELRGLQIFVEA